MRRWSRARRNVATLASDAAVVADRPLIEHCPVSYAPSDSRPLFETPLASTVANLFGQKTQPAWKFW